MKIIDTKLLPVNDLKPHEEISEENYQVVFNDILKEQIIFNPIIVDLKTKVILDGHHRFTVAKRLNFLWLPCLAIDYLDDTIISVFPRRENTPISKQLVLQAGITRNLFPNKTTRHVLHTNFSTTPYPLHLLSTPEAQGDIFLNNYTFNH